MNESLSFDQLYGVVGPDLVCAADVAAVAVRWLWPGRVPLGKVTLVVGDPGCGKSLLALDMAARVTRGLPWPDEARDASPETPRPVGRVVLLSAEDDLADTIRPRFDAAGGEAGRLVELRSARRGEGRRGFSLASDLDALRQALEETGEVRLIILDPLTAYLGGSAGHSNAEVRGLLAPLAALAEEANAAVVAVTHLNKSTRLSLIYRAMGSLGFVAASRAVWAVLPDREEPGRMLLAPIKCNLAERPSALAFRIVRSAAALGAPALAWEPEPADFDPGEEQWGPGVGREPRWRAAAEWVRQALAGGPVACQEVERAARVAGITMTSLLKAKRRVGVEAYRVGFDAPWLWRLATETAGEPVGAPDGSAK
ncbi:MAG TPA: AAA family ATPase [Planctomycetota bacterium]|nr:AAA family ATPase [Planctomycetota bacterium]